jgi:hypothetical protein
VKKESSMIHSHHYHSLTHCLSKCKLLKKIAEKKTLPFDRIFDGCSITHLPDGVFDGLEQLQALYFLQEIPSLCLKDFFQNCQPESNLNNP